WHRNQCSVSITFGKEHKIRKVAMVIYWTKARSRATKRPRRRPGQEQHGEPSGRLSDSPTSLGRHELGDPPNRLFPPRVADLDPKYVGVDAFSLEGPTLP